MRSGSVAVPVHLAAAVKVNPPLATPEPTLSDSHITAQLGLPVDEAFI